MREWTQKYSYGRSEVHEATLPDTYIPYAGCMRSQGEHTAETKWKRRCTQHQNHCGTATTTNSKWLGTTQLPRVIPSQLAPADRCRICEKHSRTALAIINAEKR